jgi:hypothetical protein
MKGRVIIEISSGDYDGQPHVLSLQLWRTASGNGIESDKFPAEEITYATQKAIAKLQKDWEYELKER